MNTLTDLYIVQVCWFSGPRRFDPVDYPRLFYTHDAAQALAHQSAHLLSRNHQYEPVRTIPLGSAGSNNNSSYGFSVAGALFWVRKVRGQLLHHSAQAEFEPYVLVCGGVVGTTPQTRRIHHNDQQCVVFGNWNQAHVSAMEYNEQQQQQAQVQVKQIKVHGSSFCSSQDWWKEWPLEGLQPPQGEMTNSKRRGDMDTGNLHEIDRMDENQADWNMQQQEQEDAHMMHRPSKRVCMSSMSLGEAMYFS